MTLHRFHGLFHMFLLKRPRDEREEEDPDRVMTQEEIARMAAEG